MNSLLYRLQNNNSKILHLFKIEIKGRKCMNQIMEMLKKQFPKWCPKQVHPDSHITYYYKFATNHRRFINSRILHFGKPSIMKTPTGIINTIRFNHFSIIKIKDMICFKCMDTNFKGKSPDLKCFYVL